MKKLLIIGVVLAAGFSASLHAQTDGTLTFSFTPVTKSGGYSGTKNDLAVWIQTNAGGFVKTKLRYAGGGTSDHLPTYAVNSGGTSGNCLSAACNKTDATTGATLSSFTSKSITWDGKNVNGTVNGTTVADGVYKVTIQETWDHGTSGTTIKSYTFTKGTAADHQTPANDADFTNIKLDWVPAVAGAASIATSAVSGSPFCAGVSINVPYTISGTYTSGNIFTAQLSSSSGSFTSALAIGTVNSTVSGTISATIPSGTAAGTGYRIRIISSTPAITGTDNGTNLSIVAGTPPTKPNAGPDQTLSCVTTATLSGNTPVSGTGIWSLLSGKGTISSPSSPTSAVTGLGTGANTFMWTISSGSCTSGSDNVIITESCTGSNTLATTAVSGSPFCSSTSLSVQVSFTSTGTFSGFYTAQLSDLNGSFSSPVSIGSGSGSPISAQIPDMTPAGTAYRIRVINSAPATTGTDNGTDLVINSCNAIVTGKLTASLFCSTTTYDVTVPYTVVGMLMGPFIAQLSDIAGSFDYPTNIGYSSSNSISATIPPGTLSGSNYRIRVKDFDSGTIGSDNGNNLFVNTCSSPNGIETFENDGIAIYPNPATDNLTVNVKEYKNMHFIAHDATGRMVLQFPLNSTANNLDISALENGLYIYQITTINGNTIKAGKFNILK